jgi:putative hemolysin
MIFIIELSCLFVASFFAGMETGLLSADKLKIYAKKEKGYVWAISADFLLKKPERLLATTLIGTNVAVVSSTFVPVSFFLNTFVKILMFLLRQNKSGEKLPRSRDDFRLLMHLSSRESGFGYDDFRTIDDILDFGLTIASEAMVPLHRYSVFNIDESPKELLRIASNQNQRYFPCYRDRSDNIIGFIDVEDFCDPVNVSLTQVLHDPIFFPEVKPLSDLLYSMIEQNLHVVFLCDEYGVISGIITQQHIAAELIGAIPGNLHTEKEDVIISGKNMFIATGKTDIEYLSHVINIKIKKGNNQTN